MEKRSLKRKDLEPLAITGLITVQDLTSIANEAELVEASTSGFKILIPRKNFLLKVHKGNLDVSNLHGLEISLNIPAMDLDITGIIVRSRFIGKDTFEIGIDYTSDAPEYWRECLCDLLPAPGEISHQE